MNIHATYSVPDRIADELLDHIQRGRLTKGSKLPSERQLIKAFGVSRLACREALAKLQGMGIIETRHGKGIFLADIRSLSVAPAVLRLLHVQGEIHSADIAEARLIIEPAAAGLAAKRADRDQRKALEAQPLETDLSLGTSGIVERARRFAEADVAFHQAVAIASGNPVLPMLLKTMHELLVRVRLEALLLKPDIIARALADHRRIAAAVVRGDVTAARKAMERHIRLRGKEYCPD